MVDTENKWTNVRILTKLAEEIETALPHTTLPNMARFVDDAVRQKLREVNYGQQTDREHNIPADQEAQRANQGSGSRDPLAE